MASIIIDGYNLIGIQHKDLEKQRQKLIDTLVQYRKIKTHDIIVVFDGWKSGGEESRSITGGVTIIYSRLGEKADAVIKRIVFSEKRQWLVVSSDREIADHAWANGSVALSADDFWNILERSQKSVAGDFEPIEQEDDEDLQRRKGSPKKLSKKEKARKRALRKL